MKYDTILVKCSSIIASLFMPELQKGIYVPSLEGTTIYSFLTENCGFSESYITEKVKTVLIDGGPVDDIFNIKIKDGGVCALSGAMPGIVGAMMRIGSPYASMRDSITVKPDELSDSVKEINYQVKLFNVILADMGPDFFKRGVLVEKKRISDFFVKHGDEIFSNSSGIFLNGSPLEAKRLIAYGIEDSKGLIIFKVEIEDENKS